MRDASRIKINVDDSLYEPKHCLLLYIKIQQERYQWILEALSSSEDSFETFVVDAEKKIAYYEPVVHQTIVIPEVKNQLPIK